MNTLAFPIDNGLISGDGLTQILAKFIAQSGVIEPNALTVSPMSSPDMKVRISGSTNDDHLVVLKPSGGYLAGWNREEAEVIISPNITGVTKTDAIVAYFDLTAGDEEIPEAPNALKFIAVRRPGSETGAVTDGQIDSEVGHEYWHRLANMAVPHNATSISGGITSTRQYAGINGELLKALSVGTAQLKNESITNAKLSTTAGELGGEWLDWTPTISTTAPMTIGSIVVQRGQYIQIGKTVHFVIVASFTVGGTGGKDIMFTLPTPISGPNMTYPFSGFIQLDSIVNSGISYWSSGALLGIIRRYDASNWTTGANRAMFISGTYEAA